MPTQTPTSPAKTLASIPQPTVSESQDLLYPIRQDAYLSPSSPATPSNTTPKQDKCPDCRRLISSARKIATTDVEPMRRSTTIKGADVARLVSGFERQPPSLIEENSCYLPIPAESPVVEEWTTKTLTWRTVCIALAALGLLL